MFDVPCKNAEEHPTNENNPWTVLLNEKRNGCDAVFGQDKAYSLEADE